MLKIILFLMVVFLINPQLGAQENLTGLSVKKEVKKGTLYYINGENRPFKKLNFIHSNIEFTDVNGEKVTESLADIDHIDGRVNTPGWFALAGGVAGLAIGAVAGSIAYPDRSFEDWLIDEFNEENEGHTVSKEEVPIIVGCTLAGAGIGALLGMTRKEKTLYKNNTSLDVFPGLTATPGEQHVFSMHVVLTIH